MTLHRHSVHDPVTLRAAGGASAAAGGSGPGPGPARNPASWRRVLNARRRDAALGYLFVAPQVLGVMVFVVVPLVLVVYYSFHSWNTLSGQFTYSGTDNYKALARDTSLPSVLIASAWFSVGLVVLNIVLALLLAELLNRKGRGIGLFRTLFFSPVVVSLVAWTLTWRFLLQDNGGINGLLSVVGIHGPNWLQSGPTAMLSVIVVQVFKNVGLNMVLFLSALQGVPAELKEAARVDGAGRLRVFFRITLPLISPMVLLAVILTIVGSLQVFAQIDVLTQGGPGLSTTVLVYYLYQQAFQFHQFGYGATLALLLFAVVLILTVIQWQLRKKWVFYEQ
jgi:multiple sugar transport system permease protein